MNKRTAIVLVVSTALIQAALWFAGVQGVISRGVSDGVRFATTWTLILGLAAIASRHIAGLRTDLQVEQDRHQSTRGHITQLEALNEMLLTLGRSKDVGLAFQALARHVGHLVPCDRLGLALVRDSGQAVLTYSARVSEPERRRRPRPDMEFSLDRSLFGQVVRTCEALILPDLASQALDFHDASVLASQGFQSALVLPLISRNRAIGALMMTSRRGEAFTEAHRDSMQPLAEILAFAFVSQQQHHALEKFETMESMSELTISLASEINSALQGVIGEAAILRGQHPELAPALEAIDTNAERISVLLERMRSAARERMGDADLTGAIPASPEAFAQDESFR